MLILRRGLQVHSSTRCVLLSTASINNDNKFQFESLAFENKKLLPAPIVTRRVLEYLEVNPNIIKQVLSSKKVQPLPQKTLFELCHVHKLTPLARWGFQQLQSNSLAADAVFDALRPHANMARGKVWWQYFLRQFFFSNAPLEVFLRVYKKHRNASAASSNLVDMNDQQANDDMNGDNVKDDAREMNAVGNNKQTAINKKKESSKHTSAVTILAENKKWEWVPQFLAPTLMKELCFRGRYAEAIEWYTLLPLSDTVRRDIVNILQDYEQYLSMLYLYEVHRTMGNGVMPLDVALELNALKNRGLVEEMEIRFQKLPAKEQSRADVQKVMGN
ncbi:hypothetical protein Plhal703r1_c29g0116111 [Plasmopara halstedii]